MSDRPSHDLEPGRVRELCDELLEAWSYQPSPSHKHPKREVVSRAVAVWGLAAHTHRLASAILDLCRAGKALEAVPAARSAYEAALKAHWIGQIPEGVQVFLLDGMRSRAGMVREFRQTPWPGAEEAAARAGRSTTRRPTPTSPTTQRTSGRCVWT
jgi:hypothetical protein